MSRKQIAKIIAHNRTVGGCKIFGICCRIQFLGKATENGNALGLCRKFLQKLTQSGAKLSVTAPRHQIVERLGKRIVLQLCKGRVLRIDCRRIAVIVFFYEPVHNFGGNGEHLACIRHTEGGRERESLKIGTHRFLKECVNGRDLRTAQKEELARKMCVFGICRHRIGQRFGNSALELCGGGTGKGNNQHAGEIGRVFFVGQLANDTLGKHACFTRSCGGRHE